MCVICFSPKTTNIVIIKYESPHPYNALSVRLHVHIYYLPIKEGYMFLCDYYCFRLLTTLSEHNYLRSGCHAIIVTRIVVIDIAIIVHNNEVIRITRVRAAAYLQHITYIFLSLCITPFIRFVSFTISSPQCFQP